MDGLKNAAVKYNIDFQTSYAGGMFGFFSQIRKDRKF